MTPDVCLAVDRLSLNYGKRPIISNLSIELRSSKGLWAISGPNGAGKTTLIESLVGMKRPRAGKISLDGKPLAPFSSEVVYLPQRSALERDFPLNVSQLVAMGLWRELGVWGRLKAHHKARIAEALKWVGMAGFEEAPIHTLSGGQQQRVLFARMMMQAGKVLILDEPFNNVDEKTSFDLIGILQRLQKEKGCLILVSLHNKQWIEEYFPWVLLLSRHSYCTGKSKEILKDPNLKEMQEQSFHWD